ncbi:dirigent protein [Streptomyces litmocidini]|uniref:allene oxide cyclase barrel-like domain-containing protein n=1 Tax=Streptomyces TaxID=1883 RepID=UPI000F486798|nr:dirigent protein [Streptomyces sp. PanSC19]ROQ34128.1 dirigent-like protein [Streptomyces sp. PanSC19]
MTRSSRRIGALCACTVAAAAFAAAPAPVSADDGDGFEFTLYAKQIPPPATSESNPPPKVGDTPVFADDLFRTKGGDKVGRDGVSCAVVRVSGDQVDMNCVGTIVLNGGPGGQLTAQALTTFDTSNDSPSAFDLAVTGGTGDFKDARGYIRSTPDGDYDRMEFHINTR